MLGAAAVLCAAAIGLAVWPSARSLSSGPPRDLTPARSTQLSFDLVSKVPHCKDYFGTGVLPAEGHAVLFVQPPEASTMYYETELTFDSAGWVADDVTLGDKDDVRHFTLYIYAITTEADDRLKQLPPHHPIEIMPLRLMDAMVVIRDDTSDTC